MVLSAKANYNDMFYGDTHNRKSFGSGLNYYSSKENGAIL